MRGCREVHSRGSTIPQLAERLGVSSTTVRDWIASGQLEEPRHETVLTKRVVYFAHEVEKIAKWYANKIQQRGGTRGPGMVQRIEKARAL